MVAVHRVCGNFEAIHSSSIKEQLGNWNLHLIAVKEMLNMFAVTGHINYAKSSRLYLQLMRLSVAVLLLH